MLRLIILLFFISLESFSQCNVVPLRNNFEWIDTVKIGSYVQASGKNLEKVSNFTDLNLGMTYKEGDTVDVELIPGYKRNPYRCYWRLWLDINGDGNYTSDERVFQTKGKYKQKGYFIVPPGAGGATPLRVAMGWKVYPTCSRQKHGEIEYYTMDLEPLIVYTGDASFDLPQTLKVESFLGSSSVGVIDNDSNQFTINIPYTNGFGDYGSYTSAFTLNRLGTGYNGDQNSFRLSYPAGTFSSTGEIVATIEVNGDQAFYAQPQPIDTEDTIVVLDFQLNGISKGNINLNVVGESPAVSGSANFTLPQTAIVISINDGSSVVDLQGVIDNNDNQLTVSIPYTNGVGEYDAYTSDWISNNPGTSQSGDANSFRISYPAGTFNSTGNIIATIEVDGDESFNAEKQLFGIQKVIASLDFQVNGNSQGSVNLDVIGGIPDRNFADPDHKFIYLPITAADGNVWLNNNLGANYSNMNHAQFNPTQQAIANDDHHAYGSLFQWGRYSDGHELINYTSSTVGVGVNGFTSTNASSDTPVNNLFITETSAPFDWRDPQNHNLWQGETGTNNPCPNGYRLPTHIEMTTLMSAEGITNVVTAASSSLAFSTPGLRNYTNGTVMDAGINIGFYWASSVDNNFSYFNYFSDNDATESSAARVYAFGVRCIKD